MTDQTYKLVPVKPTAEMLDAGINGLSDSGIGDAYIDDSRHCYQAMIAAAPEPVCKWTNDGLGAFCGVDFTTGCGKELHNLYDPFPLCPHCGKKIEES